MMIWIEFALVALAVAAVMVAPAAYARSAGQTGGFLPAGDARSIYYRRMAEVETDLVAGRLAEADAEAARIEIARQVIAADQGMLGELATKPAKSSSLWLVGAFMAVPLLALPIYWASGNPAMIDQPLAGRSQPLPDNRSMAELLQSAEQRLEANPDDGAGWAVVAPIYAGIGRFEQSATAYRNAARLLGRPPQLLASLAEILTVMDHGRITAEARSLFVEAGAALPEDPRPGFYLALADMQAGDYQNSIVGWQKTIAMARAEEPWLELARHYLNQARRNQPPSLPQAANVGPSGEQVDAAAEMSLEERTKMIRAMVTGLADRLADAPNDLTGWSRLLRSYRVLGDNGAAQAAYDRAVAHYYADPAALATLKTEFERSGP